MALAVWMLSPVIMRTMTPARCAVRTASLTSSRRGSMMPTMPSQTSAARSGGSSSQPGGSSAAEVKSRCAMQSVRRALSAMVSTCASIRCRTVGVSAAGEPSAVV